MPTGPRPAPPVRTARIAFNGTYGTTSWTNVMHLFLSGSTAVTEADLNSICDQSASLFISHLLLQCNIGVTLRSTEILYNPGGDLLAGFSPVSGAGGSNGTPLPANIAMCISWHINQHYKGGHPRTYLPGQEQQFTVDHSSWSTAHVSSTTAQANQFHTALEALPPMGSRVTSVQHGVVSYIRQKEWRNPPVFYRISDAEVDTRIDSQRRRLGADRPG